MGWVDGLNIALVISLIANVILGLLHSKYKGKLIRIASKITYIIKFLDDLEQALKDNKITPQEAVKLIEDAKQILQDP